MDENIECLECTWTGDASELVSKTDEIHDIDYSYCPNCGSDNVNDID